MGAWLYAYRVSICSDQHCFTTISLFYDMIYGDVTCRHRPDNEPAVSCMDWQTGQVTAKYWVTNLLAMTVGTNEYKAIAKSTVTAPATLYALPYTINGAVLDSPNPNSAS